MDHAVEVVALEEELRLAPIAREAVDDEAVIPVMLGEPLPHHALDQVIADELAGRHGAPDLGSEFGVPLYVPPEDVADADVAEIEVLGKHGGLGPLAAALHAHDDVFPHGATLACGRPSG